MKLAWKELKFGKKKYLMVEMILVLMIFMVLFLSGLANGLGRAVSSGIDNMNSDYYIISEDSEDLITVSSLSEEVLEAVKTQTTNQVTTLDIQRSYLKMMDSVDKKDVTYFAISSQGFLVPEIDAGSLFSEDKNTYQIVLDDSYQTKGIQIGDRVTDAATDIKMEVVGFTKDASYSHTGVGYISTSTYEAICKNMHSPYETQYHAFAMQGTDISNISLSGIKIENKKTIISNLPGYAAEQLTINMILWVLVVISSVILGVFFYVITIQKQRQFGVLKAIGMEMKNISKMIVIQVFLLASFGTVIGNVLAFGIASILPSSMPFYLEGKSAFIVSGTFILISILCSLISTRKIAKVDAIVTIGGNE
ncbi:MAG: ABC transporter permease [Lachnotalea sp.]